MTTSRKFTLISIKLFDSRKPANFNIMCTPNSSNRIPPPPVHPLAHPWFGPGSRPPGSARQRQTRAAGDPNAILVGKDRESRSDCLARSSLEPARQWCSPPPRRGAPGRRLLGRLGKGWTGNRAVSRRVGPRQPKGAPEGASTRGGHSRAESLRDSTVNQARWYKIACTHGAGRAGTLKHVSLAGWVGESTPCDVYCCAIGPRSSAGGAQAGVASAVKSNWRVSLRVPCASPARPLRRPLHLHAAVRPFGRSVRLGRH